MRGVPRRPMVGGLRRMPIRSGRAGRPFSDAVSRPARPRAAAAPPSSAGRRRSRRGRRRCAAPGGRGRRAGSGWCRRRCRRRGPRARCRRCVAISRVAAGLAVGDAGDRPQHARPEVLAELPVERQVELGQLALEVEVELAAGLVELGRRLEHARGDPGRRGRPGARRRPGWAGRPGPGPAASSPAAAARRASRCVV